MTDNALVLGARIGTGNIGEAVFDKLQADQWDVAISDCHMSGDLYDVPDLGSEWEEYDALVITLGKEGITPMRRTTDAAIEDTITANLTLPLRCIRAWVHARGALGGKCVVIGSYAYDHSPTACVPYCAAKAGLAHAVQGLAWELTDAGYQFHIVHPYHVPSTPMGGRVVEAMMDERGFTLEGAHEYQRKDLKLDDHLHPSDIARVVAWLLDEPTAPWLSGGGIQMYGGVSIVDHVNYQVPTDVVHTDGLTELMDLLGLVEVPPTEALDAQYIVRWWACEETGMRVHVVGHGHHTLSQGLGHLCVVVDPARWERCLTCAWFDRYNPDSPMRRVWLRGPGNLRAEVQRND